MQYSKEDTIHSPARYSILSAVLAYLSFLPLIGLVSGPTAIILSWENRLPDRKNFTLISLLGILSGSLLIPSFFLHYNLVEQVTYRRLERLDRHIQEFRSRYNRYPDSLKELKFRYPRIRISDPFRKSMMHMESAGEDSTTDLVYRSELPYGDAYRLYSRGPDLQSTDDDIYSPRSSARNPTRGNTQSRNQKNTYFFD